MCINFCSNIHHRDGPLLCSELLCLFNKLLQLSFLSFCMASILLLLRSICQMLNLTEILDSVFCSLLCDLISLGMPVTKWRIKIEGVVGLLAEWVGRSARWVGVGGRSELGCEIGLAVEEEERRWGKWRKEEEQQERERERERKDKIFF